MTVTTGRGPGNINDMGVTDKGMGTNDKGMGTNDKGMGTNDIPDAVMTHLMSCGAESFYCWSIIGIHPPHTTKT